MARTEVHKFGGTSVGDAKAIANASGLVARAAGPTRLAVVASAMAGATDDLVRAASAAAAGDRELGLALAGEIVERHIRTLEALDVDDPAPVRVELDRLGRELSELVSAVVYLGELTPRTRDRLLSCGEKLSVRLLAATLRGRGVDAEALDADAFLETDGRFGEAQPLAGLAERSIAAALGPVLDEGRVAVVTGFCGRGPDGATTTLGRGGSDLSATLVAAALDADEVVLWTDVEGVFTADPRVVAGARVIRHLNYREAAELSYYGAKVLHQRSMIPLVSRGIPVRTLSSFSPGTGGTVVDGRYTPGSHPVKAISAIREQSLISVEGKGMAGVPGIAERLFRALAEQSISVTMISQSSSESSICLAVPSPAAPAAESALKQAFRPDLSRGDIEEIEIVPGVGIVAAVGLGMAHVPGVAARFFGALARRQVNVVAIAQGSSELNISAAVEREHVDDAVEAAHHEFGLHRLDTGEDAATGLDLILMGFGNIARSLAGLVADRRAHVSGRFGLEPRVVALCDRSGYLLRPTGIPEEELREIAAAKASGSPVASLEGARESGDPVDMIRHALDYRLARPVLVDLTDSDDSGTAFLEAFRLGCDVVTANKKPLAGDLEAFRGLTEAAARSGRVLKAEATVGAGLPVIDTLEMLVATGDRLTRAEGCLSGTLAFLMMKLEEGAAFSDAVAEAVALGYTEPDPVADLSGADVARKAVILGRLSGLADAGTTVSLEGLVDDGLAGKAEDDLLAALKADYDGPVAERVQRARDDGRVLRYVARVEPGRITVGPEAVAPNTPLGGLQGTDNMIVFESERYEARPLVVTGPGAGIEVTAMGVLGDILRIAAERTS